MLSISRVILGLALATLTLPALAASDKLQQHMLNKMDANKDGVITLDEFQPQGQKRMTQSRHQSRRRDFHAEMQARQTAKMAEHQGANGKIQGRHGGQIQGSGYR